MVFSDDFDENLGSIISLSKELSNKIVISESDSSDAECALYYLNKAVLSGKCHVSEDIIKLQELLENYKGDSSCSSDALEILKASNYYDKTDDKYEYVKLGNSESFKKKLYAIMILVAAFGIVVSVLMLILDSSTKSLSIAITLLGFVLEVLAVFLISVDNIHKWWFSKFGVNFITKTDILNHLFYAKAMRNIVTKNDDMFVDICDVLRVLYLYVNSDSFMHGSVEYSGKYLVEVDRLRNKLIQRGKL